MKYRVPSCLLISGNHVVGAGTQRQHFGMSARDCIRPGIAELANDAVAVLHPVGERAGEACSLVGVACSAGVMLGTCRMISVPWCQLCVFSCAFSSHA